MGDLHDRLEKYESYIASGIDSTLAQRQAYLSDDEVVLAEHYKLQRDEARKQDETYAPALAADNAAMLGVTPLDMSRDVRLAGFFSEYSNSGDPNQIVDLAVADPDLGWWGKGVDTLRKVAESGVTRGIIGTLGIPHQLITHGLAGEDLRKAIPTYLRPDEWDKNPELDYSYVSFIEGVERKLMPELWTPEEMLAATEDMSGGKKTATRIAYKLAEFGLDVASDPITYAAGLGIGGKAVNLFRRLAPAPVTAGALTKIAAHTGQLDDLFAAQKSLDKMDKWLGKRIKDGKIDADMADTLTKKVDASKKYIDHEIELRTGAQGDQILAEGVPHSRLKRKDLPEDATDLEKAVHKARDEARKDGWLDPVSPRHLDDDPYAAVVRAVEGPDVAEHAAENIARIAKGIDPIDDLAVHPGIPLNGTKTSTNIRYSGVGRDGRILQAAQDLRKVTTRMEDIQNVHLQRIRTFQDDIARVTEFGGDPADLTKMVAESEKVIKDLGKQIKYVRKHGALPKGADKYNVKWPSGPRREIIDAADFAETTFGEGWFNFVRRGLYPKSYTMRPLFLPATDRLFGETWRILDRHAPRVMTRTFGALRDMDTSLQRSQHYLMQAFEEAGLYRNIPKDGILSSVGLGGVAKGVTLNKEKSRHLYDLLDTPAITKEKIALETDKKIINQMTKTRERRKILENTASPKMLVAEKKIRALLDQTAGDLGLAPSEYISGYIQHMIKKNHFSGGYKPISYVGASVKQTTPGFLKRRTGNYMFHERDAVSTLDHYFRGVAHELHIRPALNDIQTGLREAIKHSGDVKGFAWLESYGQEVIHRLQGKPTWGRQFVEKLKPFVPQIENVDKVAVGASMAAYSSVLSGSTRYFMMSLAQALNSTVPGAGHMRTLRGLARMMTPEGRLVAKHAGVWDETKGLFEGLDGQLTQIATTIRMGAPSIRDAEALIRGTSMHASISSQLSKMGIKNFHDLDPNMANEVVAMAMRDARNMNHVFGFLGKPLLFNKASMSGSTVLTQFTSFPFKQVATITENSLKNPGYLADYMLYAGWMSKMADHLGVDLDKYIGTPEFRTAEDMTTIPVTFGAALLNVVSKHSSDSLPTERRKAREEFERALEPMTPFLTSYKRWSEIMELVHGEDIELRQSYGGSAGRVNKGIIDLMSGAVQGNFPDKPALAITQLHEDSTAPLKRIRETSLYPETGAVTEVFAVLSQMRSVEDRKYEAERKAATKAESQANYLKLQMADEFAKSGEDFSPEKIRKLSVELLKMGVEVKYRDLENMKVNALQRQEIPLIMRRALHNHRLLPITDAAKELEMERGQ